MTSLNNFLKTLNYLGGNLGLFSPIDEFVDLETFFLDSTRFLKTDTRVFQTIMNWHLVFSGLLSPSKIRRLILEGYEFDPVSLGTILTTLMDLKAVSKNWELLIPYSEGQKKKHSFSPNPKKYLKITSFIVNNVPEIKFRSMGAGQVHADIQALTSKKIGFKSLYDLAKKIHSPRNLVNSAYRSLRNFGLIQNEMIH